MGVSKTIDHIQIKIKMPNPSKEPPVSSKAQTEDLKDMDILCSFKIKIDSQTKNKAKNIHFKTYTLNLKPSALNQKSWTKKHKPDTEANN